MHKKILSICIPTFNRPDELEELSTNFLAKVLQSYGDRIEIIVRDNSAGEVARKNAQLLHPSIDYSKNLSNLGFGGNLIELAKAATTPFIWIISDNDKIIWDGFVEMVSRIERAMIGGESERFDCLMLCFQTKNYFGDVQKLNRAVDWGLSDKVTMSELLRRPNGPPYVLFSSAVIRLDKRPIASVRERFPNNDFIQIVLFLEMLNAKSVVSFLNQPVIDYQPEYHGRFPISRLAASMREVRGYLKAKYQVPENPKSDYGVWLNWLVLHKSGLYRINEADRDLVQFTREIWSNLTPRNAFRFLLLVTPNGLFLPFYLIYRSYKEMRGVGRFSIRELVARYTKNREFSKKNLDSNSV